MNALDVHMSFLSQLTTLDFGASAPPPRNISSNNSNCKLLFFVFGQPFYIYSLLSLIVITRCHTKLATIHEVKIVSVFLVHFIVQSSKLNTSLL